MVLKLYANPQSACSRRVVLILHEKQVPYELVETDWSVVKTDEWLKSQPFGQVPYIDDDGFILFESCAVARYISTKYASSGTPLLPTSNDPQSLALLDQAISVGTANFDPYASGLVGEKMFKQYQGQQAEPVLVTKYETVLSGKMEGFERLLGKHKYMAGDSLTFVDFLYLPHGSMLTGIGYDYLTNEIKYPNVARWFKEVTSRDSWKAVAPGVAKGL